MLNKILEYEKQALNDKLHMGICIGVAVEDYDQVKVKYAKIDANLKDDLTDSFDFSKHKFLMNPGIYPVKPVKKIYNDIHRKLLLDLEEDGMNLHNILGPAKAPGQIYKVMNFRPAYTPSRNADSETQAQSMATHAVIYYDDDQHIPMRQLAKDVDDAPKKLLKRGGKKGKRIKKQPTIKSKEDEKFAVGPAITFQKGQDQEDEEISPPLYGREKAGEETYDKIIHNYNNTPESAEAGYQDEDEEEVDQIYSDDQSDQQEVQNQRRLQGFIDANEDEDNVANSLDRGGLKRKH